MTEGNSAIEIKNLTKTFGNFTALDKLDLNVKTGEVHGFLGPNGAGKSTTIRIVLGILRKTAGTVKVLGGDPWEDAVELHQRLAYVPGDVNLWPNLSGGEAIDLLARLRGGFDKKRRDELLHRFQLDPTKKCRTYSKGNRQKVALVAALSSDVDLYVMDEPTSGLDPLMEAVFQDYVRELKRTGKTILLSSHILAEAEALCDTVTIIRNGHAVETGTLAELRHLTRLSVTADTRKSATKLAKMAGVHDLSTRGYHAEFQVDNDALDEVIAYISQLGIDHFVSTPPSLEKLFLRHYGDKITETGKESEEA